MFSVFVLAALNFYTAIAIVFLIALSIGLSYRVYPKIYQTFTQPFVKYDLSKPSEALALIINELHLLVVTFLLGVNFISVFRPFPIGWDDLGAYMNHPKIISES